MGILGSILGAIASIAFGALSVSMSKKQSDENIERQDAFNERNSISGRVKEARENGISPLAVLDNTGTSAVVSAPQASADYSGFGEIGSALADLGKSFDTNQTQRDISREKNLSTEEINSEARQNEKEIAQMNIDARSRDLVSELNNTLLIATEKNATDESIAEQRLIFERKLEQLRIQNEEYLHNQELEQQLKIAQEELKAFKGHSWRQFGASIVDILVTNATRLFTGGINIDIGGKSNSNPIGFRP